MFACRVNWPCVDVVLRSLKSRDWQLWWFQYLDVVYPCWMEGYEVGCGCGGWCVRLYRVMEFSYRRDDLRGIPLLLTVGPPSPHLHFLHESMAWSHGLWVWKWDGGRKGWWLVAAGAAAAGALELIAVEARYWDETVCMSCLLVLHIVYEQRAPACLHRLHY